MDHVQDVLWLDAEEDEWEEWLLCSTNTSHIIQCLHHPETSRLYHAVNPVGLSFL